MNDPIQQFEPMKPSRFSELTGYSKKALQHKTDETIWLTQRICFKVGNEWFFDYYRWKQWIKQQQMSNGQQGEATKSRSRTRVNAVGSASSLSPRPPTT